LNLCNLWIILRLTKKDRLRYDQTKSSRLRAAIIVCIVLGCFAIPCSSLGRRSDEHGKDDGIVLSQPLSVAWRYQTDQTTDLTPAADAQTVFVPLSSGVLMALNASDGKLNWKAEAGGVFSAIPVVDDRSVYMAQRYGEQSDKPVGGTLRALSKTTGVTLWMRTLPVALSAGLAVDATAVFAATSDGTVYAFDKRTSLVLWSCQYPEEFTAQPTVAGNNVYFGSKSGTVRAFNVKTGDLAWQYKTNGPVLGSVAVFENVVYIGSGDGNVYAFSEPRKKVLWQRRTGAAVQAVTVVPNGVLASSLDNFAYLLSLNKGSLIWRRQLPGRISSRPITAADAALFTPFSTDQAIVLNLHDGKTANTLPLGEENSSSAAAVAVNNLVLITIPHGLLAFSSNTQK
jgi:outer membrane protein assembly factor BamB